MRKIVAFGAGKNFYSLVERLDEICEISAFSDNDQSKWGQYLLGDERVCVSPASLCEMNNPLVLILAERESSIQAIERQCNAYGLEHQRIYDFFEIQKPVAVECHWPQTIQKKRIHKFIELLVHGTTACNFRCEYCYVWKTQDFTGETDTSEYSIKELRNALSVERLGGPCHLNACATGETLLSKQIVELTFELLEEGHYLSIITNGTISKKIDDILTFPSELLERLFFKCSFHYGELKRTNMLSVFWENIDKIKNSPCSYSIEITPCDSLIGDIEEVKKEFELHADGVMPHMTFTRDANKVGLDLLSSLSLEEYKNTWKVFDSELFDMKCELYKRKIYETCYAGHWSYSVNVMNGKLQSCYRQGLSGTVFDEGNKILPVLTVNHNCKLDYCFNNHAYLAWGDAPEIGCPNYFQVRDRETKDGFHWVKKSYAAAMRQKLYDNNFAYMGKWSDYEKLFAKDRKAAVILFNSPDYPNLGDHAIALATRRFFAEVYPDKEFIEISCEQYIRENLLIRNVIQPEDILLLNGGGYLGSLWLWLEDMSKNIIQTYIKNQIYIFPQTVFFEETALGQAEKSAFATVCNKHPNLTILLREEASFNRVKAMVNDSVMIRLIPDMVLSLNEKEECQREGALLCFRDDKESINGWDEKVRNVLVQQGFPVREFSTISEQEVYLDNREQCLEELLDKIRTAKVVVTDRLHAMIFCAITGTLCIAFDNVSKKVSETYRWLEEIENIAFCKDFNAFGSSLSKVLCQKVTGKQLPKKIIDKFEELKKYIRENTNNETDTITG